MYEHFHLDDYTFPSLFLTIILPKHVFRSSLSRHVCNSADAVLSFSFVWFQFLIFICAAPLWTVNSRLLQILFIKNIPWKSIVNFSFRLCNISEEDFDLLFHLFPKCGWVCLLSSFEKSLTKELLIFHATEEWRLNVPWDSLSFFCKQKLENSKVRVKKMGRVVNNDDSASAEVWGWRNSARSSSTRQTVKNYARKCGF